MATCEACGAEVLDIDVRCQACGKPIGSSGAHRMVGSIVLGQYELVDVLGQGGMSVVFKGRHKMTAQEVALKILPPELAAHSQVKGRFLEEAKALAQLDHPNIVHLHNFGQENGSFVLAMQLVKGQTWERLIMAQGRIDWPVSIRLAIDVLRALEYAHGRGIVHRDMKPSNVLIRDDDGSATVMDFGIAKMTTSSRLTATGQTMGTVRYMSPEQVRGQEVDARTDIYSLGATLYESLVGDTPFDGNTHFEIMTRHLNDPPQPPSVRGIVLPPVLEQALMRSLAKNVDDRFASARDFRKVLEALARESGIAHDETLRLSRDAVAQARTKSGGLSRAVRTPEATAATAETSMLGPRLEPTGAHATPRRRPWLWGGLAGVVLTAGAGVLLVTMRRGDVAGAGAATAGTPADAPAATSFEPPDVAWAATADFPDQGLAVRSAAPWDPALVAIAHREATARWAAFLARRGASATPPSLTVLVVPPRVFCDSRIYEDRREPAGCQKTGNYYRPFEKTLLVVDDRARLPLNLASGVADATCVHDAAPGVCDAVNEFVAEVRKAKASPE
jgi:tRNA A-37 threonylcarbamoyl transferase component Bud32